MAIALKENRPVRGCEAIAERPDGTRIPFIPYPTPLRDADGRLTGAINMLVDITERKRSEQALRQRERELHEAQRIARMGHWRLDVATAKLEWSAGTHLLMGTSPDDHTPNLKNLISCIHPDDRRPYIHAFIDCMTSGKTSQWEARVHNKDGREWVAWIEGRCETDETGKVIALFGICQDVTEQRRMQAKLREARDAARAADRAKSTFLACMSHELRTPLNAIIGFSDLLQTEMFGPLGSDQYLEYAADINSSGHHLLELVNDLLDMARVEAGMVDLQEETIDVAMLIHEAVNLARGSVPGITHKFDVRLPEATPLLMADRRRMKQVLINLIGNAVKFTPSGGRIGIVVGEGRAAHVDRDNRYRNRHPAGKNRRSGQAVQPDRKYRLPPVSGQRHGSFHHQGSDRTPWRRSGDREPAWGRHNGHRQTAVRPFHPGFRQPRLRRPCLKRNRLSALSLRRHCYNNHIPLNSSFQRGRQGAQFI